MMLEDKQTDIQTDRQTNQPTSQLTNQKDENIAFDLRWRHYNVIKWKDFPRYWPFVGDVTGNRWILLTKASDAEPWYFLWSAPEQMVE